MKKPGRVVKMVKPHCCIFLGSTEGLVAGGHGRRGARHGDYSVIGGHGAACVLWLVCWEFVEAMGQLRDMDTAIHPAWRVCFPAGALRQ